MAILLICAEACPDSTKASPKRIVRNAYFMGFFLAPFLYDLLRLTIAYTHSLHSHPLPFYWSRCNLDQ